MGRRSEPCTVEEQVALDLRKIDERSEGKRRLYSAYPIVHEDMAELTEWDRFIYHMIKTSWSDPSVRLEDKHSIMKIGLIKAWLTYDPGNTTKSKFITYASLCMKTEMYMFYRKRMTALKQGLTLLSSMDEEFGTNLATENLTLHSFLYDEELPTHDEILSTMEQSKFIKRAIINELSPRGARVVYYRYYRGLNQADTATKMKISRSYVSRIEKYALELLKDYLTDNKGRWQ